VLGPICRIRACYPWNIVNESRYSVILWKLLFNIRMNSVLTVTVSLMDTTPIIIVVESQSKVSKSLLNFSHRNCSRGFRIEPVRLFTCFVLRSIDERHSGCSVSVTRITSHCGTFHLNLKTLYYEPSSYYVSAPRHCGVDY
jgi:hypothetical protein